MALTLRVPTIFTAKDKVSAVVRNMSRGVQTFSDKMQRATNVGNRFFKRLTPSIGEAGRRMLEFASAATIVSGIFATAGFSGKAIMDYEQAVASFRTIVSDLNNAEFSKFENAIGSVAKDTRKSTIEVAQSFEMIAGLNAKFAETSEGLSKVSKAAIILSKASGDELGVSASNLVGIMNQFNLGAEQSNRVINVLAAGQAVGAASITQASESYKNFGSVASSANITLEQSVGLIQTLGKFSIFGAEAGTALRGVTLKLQKAGMGYKSGQFQINDALEQTKKIYDKMKTTKEKDLFLIKVFGAENISAGKILLNNMPIYHEFTKGVTGTSEAQKAAAINSNTLKNRIDELKNTWVGIITTNDKSKTSLEGVKNALKWVTDNMEDVIKWGLILVGVFAAFKAILVASQISLAVYNIALGVSSALSATASIAVGRNTIALAAYNFTAKAATAATWLWSGAVKAFTAVQWFLNAAMAANPIGLIVAAIIVLIAIVAVVIAKYDQWGAALALFLGPFGLIINIIQSFRRNWDMVVKAFKTGGILGGIKAIGRVLLDALLMPVQQLLQLLSKVPGMAKLAGAGAVKINEMRQSLGVEGVEPLDSPNVKSQKITQEKIETTKNNVDINVNDPNNRVTVKSSGGKTPIKVTKTNGQR